MITPAPIPPPNPNNETSVKSHRDRVLAAYGVLFDIVDQALRDSVPRASDFFRLLNGPMDLGVHAGNTRYLTRLYLQSRNVSSEDEDPLGFELDRVPNCGLCLRAPGYEIRILKASSEGVPKATSDARSRFYSSNQLQFAFANNQSPDSQEQATLSLVLLWSMDASYAYSRLEIACPRGEQNDGRVDCYWIVPWQAGDGSVTLRAPLTPTPEPDLDEIKPVVQPKVASS
jgi:hypothetical protein